MAFKYTPKTHNVEESSSNHVGILLIPHQLVLDMNSKSGPLVTANEYQIHFKALTARRIINNKVLNVTIPTVAFNYSQEVTSSTVDFSLKDVVEMQTALEPIHQAMLPSLLETPLFKFLSTMNFEFISSESHNIHRHPGKMHSFSGTDLDRDPTNPGVVFPLQSGNKTGIFSGLVTHNPLELGHMEFRVVTSYNEVTTKDKITTTTPKVLYEKGTCVTIIKREQPTPNDDFESILDIVKEKSYSFLINGTDKFGKDSIIHTIAKLFDEMSYTVNTDFIDADNVKTKTYNYTSRGYYNTNYDDDLDSHSYLYNKYKEKPQQSSLDLYKGKVYRNGKWVNLNEDLEKPINTHSILNKSNPNAGGKTDKNDLIDEILDRNYKGSEQFLQYLSPKRLNKILKSLKQ